MLLLIERRPENMDAGDICPICNRPKKLHIIAEFEICSKKLKDLEKSSR